MKHTLLSLLILMAAVAASLLLPIQVVAQTQPAPASAAISAPAAFPAPRPVPIVSPEIHPDRTVTFRLRAPAATEVKMWGDWDGKGNEMVKDADGVWSVTLGPIPPDIYTYSFSVDGVTMIDPANTVVKPMRSVTSSVLDIPGDPPLPWERAAGVPQGTMHLHDYNSKALGKMRRLRVYTPATYDKNGRTRYPVLYLLHGSGDNEATWSEYGRANIILDNLIAAGKVRPMIVVMTDGHASFAAAPETHAQAGGAFERDLLEDVMPFVESRYRIQTDREHRAIAGLSMGGYQSLLVGLNHRDLFAYVVGMSSDVPSEQALASFFANPVSAKMPMRLLWFADGTEDFLLKGNQAFDALLTEKKVPHVFVETPGRHTWLVWRRDLTLFAPLLFTY